LGAFFSFGAFLALAGLASASSAAGASDSTSVSGTSVAAAAASSADITPILAPELRSSAGASAMSAAAAAAAGDDAGGRDDDRAYIAGATGGAWEAERRAVIGRGRPHADRRPPRLEPRREPSDAAGSDGWGRPRRGGSDAAPRAGLPREGEPVPMCASAPDSRAHFSRRDSSILVKFREVLEHEIIFQMRVVSSNLVGNSGRNRWFGDDRSAFRVSPCRCASLPTLGHEFSRHAQPF